MGVVIGETAEIGDDCTLYQGVTLGGTGRRATRPGRSAIRPRQRRHRRLRRPGARAVQGRRRRPHRRRRGGAEGGAGRARPWSATRRGRSTARSAPGEARPAFEPYGVTGEDIPDPVARALTGLLDEVASLRARVDELESEKAAPDAPARAQSPEPDERAQREGTAMRLSTKGRYAVMAMVDLAQHGGGDRSRSPRSPSARRSRCPISSSSSPSCAAAGWSRACAGRAAAICLAHDRDETRIADIILAVDEPIRATRCTPGRADRLPRRPQPMSDPRSVGGAGQPDPSLSELGVARRCLRQAGARHQRPRSSARPTGAIRRPSAAQ